MRKPRSPYLKLARLIEDEGFEHREFAKLVGRIFGDTHHGRLGGSIHPHMLVGIFKMLRHIQIRLVIVFFAHESSFYVNRMYFPRAVPKLVTGGRGRAILRSCSGRWWPFRELPYALPPTRSCIRRGSPNAPAGSRRRPRARRWCWPRL